MHRFDMSIFWWNMSTEKNMSWFLEYMDEMKWSLYASD